MKYSMSVEQIGAVVSKISAIADKDSSVLLSFGAKDMGEKILCGARVTTSHEQVALRFMIDKPAGFSGKAEEICVKAQMFTGIVNSLMTLKSDVYIDINGEKAMGIAGVEGKAQVPIPLIAESTAAIATEKPLFNVTLKGAEFLNFLRTGLLCSAESATSGNGSNNSVIIVNTTNAELTGYSTDGNVIGYSKLTGQMAPAKDAEKEKAAFDAYCSEKNVKPDEVAVLIPRLSIDHIKNLVANVEAIRLCVGEKHVVLMLGNSCIYSTVQGATMPCPLALVKEIMGADPDSRCSFDSEEMERCVNFVTSMSELTSAKAGLSPIRLTLKDGFVNASSVAENNLNSKVKVAVSDGEGEMPVNGKFVKAALSSLRKGGVVMSFVEARAPIVTFANGNMSEGEDGKGKIAVMSVKVAEPEEESEEEATTEE